MSAVATIASSGSAASTITSSHATANQSAGAAATSVTLTIRCSSGGSRLYRPIMVTTSVSRAWVAVAVHSFVLP